MKEARLAELIGEVREEYATEAMPLYRGRTSWKRWTALAACIAFVAALGLMIPLLQPKGEAAEAPEAGESAGVSMEAGAKEEPAEESEEVQAEDTAEEPGDGVPMIPHVVVDGVMYFISANLSSYDTCPEGFAYTGEIESGEFAGEQYYTNPEQPQVIFVYTMTNNDGRVDSSNTVIPTEWHMAYVRFASEEMRGREFVCVDDQLYLSMWSAWDAVESEFYDSIEAEYGLRMEGNAPDGFASAGVTEFSGYDMWPEGSLSSNQGEMEVFVNPDQPDVILVAAKWYSAGGMHQGFDVYIRYTRK